MKAWLVTNCEGIGIVVFADTASKAKAYALNEDGFEDETFISLHVNRAVKLDGMENCEPKNNYLLNDDIRLILVRDYGRWCEEPIMDDCSKCVAHEYCPKYLA